MERINVRDMATNIPSSLTSRVALFVPSLRAGGAEKVTVRLANAMSTLGIQVDLIVSSSGPLHGELVGRVNLVNLGTGRVLTSLPKLVRYLKTQTPDAILSTMMHGNLIALWAYKLAGVGGPIVVREVTTVSVCQASSGSLKQKSLILLARRFYRWSDAVVAPSHGVFEDLLRLKLAAANKLHVIYNPVVDASLFSRAREPVDHPWFQNKRCAIIIAVGRLVAAKDYTTLVQAFSLVRQTENVRLVILGDGIERPRLLQLIHQLQLQEDVSLLGFVVNPYAFMSRSDVYVLSSRWEGMPNALIEALALGVPAVSTNCPSGPREILEGGRLGRLVPVGHPKHLAEAIRQTLHDPITPDVASIEQRFGAKAVAKEYLKLMGIEVP